MSPPLSDRQGGSLSTMVSGAGRQDPAETIEHASLFIGDLCGIGLRRCSPLLL